MYYLHSILTITYERGDKETVLIRPRGFIECLLQLQKIHLSSSRNDGQVRKYIKKCPALFTYWSMFPTVQASLYLANIFASEVSLTKIDRGSSTIIIGKVKPRNTELTVRSILVRCEDLLSNVFASLELAAKEILESPNEIAFLLDFAIAFKSKTLQTNIIRNGRTQKTEKSIHGQTCNVKWFASLQGSSSSVDSIFQNKCKFRAVITMKIDTTVTLHIRKWS